MTSTDLQLKRPAQIVERPTGPNTPPSMPDPDPIHLRISALVWIGAMGAAAAGMKLHPEFAAVSQAAAFVAFVVFLTCLFRYNHAVQRG
ncbi:hypothetical protein [Actinoplanes sp. NPDC051494]|uniref:hypothetical protein n=1 Tax=Actinoplanes sp. NPDC051494 TaxID=3363907 RepID=UPI00378F23C8